jgi:hypothetical protein
MSLCRIFFGRQSLAEWPSFNVDTVPSYDTHLRLEYLRQRSTPYAKVPARHVLIHVRRFSSFHASCHQQRKMAVASPPSASVPKEVPHLPDEILENIFCRIRCRDFDYVLSDRWIADAQSLRSICCASKRFREIALPFLYESFSLILPASKRSGNEELALLRHNRTLIQNPSLAALVREDFMRAQLMTIAAYLGRAPSSLRSFEAELLRLLEEAQASGLGLPDDLKQRMVKTLPS